MSALPLAFICFLLALPSFASAQVSSQTQPLRLPPQDVRFRGMDRDGNGVITRDEWRGSDQSFAVHDWNRDGVLSGDELRVGARQDRSWEGEDYTPESDQFYDWTARGFRNLDQNRDNRISRREWPFDLETFRRVDRNRDSVLSRAEFLGTATSDEDRNDRFNDLDADNNGYIDRDEWHGSDDAFAWLDRNDDGVLSRREVVGTDDAVRASTVNAGNRFAELDYNRNGVISRNEWHWSLGSFNQWDRNRDGVISRSEFDAVAATNDLPAPTPDATVPRTISVPANQPWTDTGISVRAGDVVTVQADGTITMSGPNDIARPGGALSGRKAPNAPVQSALAGALIAKIGDGTPFATGGSFIAQATGPLYLGVNDDYFGDNAGEYRVTLSARAR